MTETPPQDHLPASLAEIEQRIQAELDAALSRLERAEFEFPEIGSVEALAAALQNVRQTRATNLAPAVPPAPFDVDTLCSRVWNAVQDAGATTAASDAAVDTIRETVGGAA